MQKKQALADSFTKVLLVVCLERIMLLMMSSEISVVRWGESKALNSGSLQ